MTEAAPGIHRDVILNEIAGKYAAIHAYDKISWQIRSGFLTLFFFGWGIILKSYAESSDLQSHGMQSLLDRMLLVSSGLTLGGWLIDLNYIKHKFRVILALDALMEAVWSVADDLKSVPVALLKVAGDQAEMPYDCGGYKVSRRTGIFVFWIPLITVAIAVFALR